LPLPHCTNLLPRTELPVAGPPQPLLPIPTAPAVVRNQSHSGSQHNASAIPRKNCTQSARKRPHSQWFAALVLGNCTSHSHAKTHAMPLTTARSHASSHSLARKLALSIHRATFCQLRAHKRLCTKNTRTRTHTRKTHRTQTTRKPTMSSQLYIVLSAKCIYLFCLVYGLPCTAFPAGRPAEHQLIAPKKPQPGKLAKRRQAGWFGRGLGTVLIRSFTQQYSSNRNSVRNSNLPF
jgi:hypothetical protein